MVPVCLEDDVRPIVVRFVDGPRVAPGEPGRFTLADQKLVGDGSTLQPGVRFRVADPHYRHFVGTGRVLERLDRTPVPPGYDLGGAPPPGGWYGPPDRLRIPRDEHRFTNVGRRADGVQFMAYVGSAYPEHYRHDDNWMSVQRWQAVAHYFDGEGHHLRTDVRLGGVATDDRARDNAFGHLSAIYEELVGFGEPEFGDIWVKLFSVEIDGIRYRLWYERREDDGDGGYESVYFNHVLSVSFWPPWESGGYDT
jgi:hypothetical protein